MRIERRYTKQGESAYADIAFRLTTSEIPNPDGSVVFHADDVEVPDFWSQVAADVLAQKYFRKAGVPARLKKVEEETVPSWLWRSVPDEEALAALPEKERSIGEGSSKQVFERVARTWAHWGWEGGHFDSGGRTRAPSSTSSSTCWRCRWRRRTRRNGSTPACSGPMASTGRARATSTSTTRPASSRNRRLPTSIRSRTPASSSRSPTISSTKAGSWTCGCARRACSNTAPAPARTSPSCAAKAKSSPAAASHPG